MNFPVPTTTCALLASWSETRMGVGNSRYVTADYTLISSDVSVADHRAVRIELYVQAEILISRYNEEKIECWGQPDIRIHGRGFVEGAVRMFPIVTYGGLTSQGLGFAANESVSQGMGFEYSILRSSLVPASLSFWEHE